MDSSLVISSVPSGTRMIAYGQACVRFTTSLDNFRTCRGARYSRRASGADKRMDFEKSGDLSF
jgi:hypothetical protein